MKKSILTVAALLSATVVSQAVLISPTGVRLATDADITPDAVATNGGTTFLQDVGVSHGQDKWYNGSGLTENVVGGYATHDPYSGGIASRIRNTNGTDGEGALVFDLGGIYDVSGWVLWNGNEDDNRGGQFDRTEAQRDRTRRGIMDATLFTSTDGVNFDLVGAFDFAQEVYTHSTNSIAVGPALGQFNGFATVEDVTHIRLDVYNHGNDNITNFNEIAFEAIPEPASFGLLAIFGSAVLFIRRRFKN